MKPLSILLQGIHFAHKWISYICLQLGVVFMCLMTLSVLIQVVMRYIFSSPISWLEELCIYLMFFLTFLLAPYIILNKLHISMTLFYDKIINRKLKYIVNILLNMLAIFGIITIMPSIFEVVQNSLNTTTVQMPFTRGQAYMVIPFSFILMISIPVEQSLQYLLDIFTGTEK